MDIKEKIDKLRKERGWSLFKLAKESGIYPTTVYNWFNSINATPTREKIDDLCAAFGISVSSFYADVDADNLTATEIELLEAFRKIPDKKKDVAIATLKAMCE
ncbi:MAG: helix-turn-helix transcriptional regulator [Clostridia bacterium]|nr:helix-turn-helix transcriptional regulator [Clostridia bacterium]